MVTDDFYETGKHQVIWDGINESCREVASCIHFAWVKTTDFEISKETVVVK